MGRVTDDGPTPEVPLPIAPMLDLSFQLLFFAIVTYNPIPYIEGQMAMNLPKKEEKKGSVDTPPPPSEEAPPDVPLDLTLEVEASDEIGSKGLISKLTFLQGNTGSTRLKDNVQEALEELQGLLKGLKRPKEEKSDPKKPDLLKVKMPKELKWGQMVMIMDTCEKVGFQVSFIMPKDLK